MEVELKKIEFMFKREHWKVEVYKNRIDIFVDCLGYWTFVDSEIINSTNDPIKMAKNIIMLFKQYKV